MDIAHIAALEWMKRRIPMNDLTRLLLIVTTALACPLVLPVVLDVIDGEEDANA